MLVTTASQKRTTPTRTERYNAVVNLTDAGIAQEGIARVIQSDVRYVQRLLAMRDLPAGKRNAWLMGLDLKKFNCV